MDMPEWVVIGECLCECLAVQLNTGTHGTDIWTGNLYANWNRSSQMQNDGEKTTEKETWKSALRSRSEGKNILAPFK